MAEITQTILHGEVEGRMGNCMQAAIASLLDLPLDEVPHFAQYDNADYGWLWYDAFVGWAYQRGLAVEFVDESPGDGMSPRGVRHLCVGRGETVVWDPHPSRDGLVSVEDWITVRPIIDDPIVAAGRKFGDQIAAAAAVEGAPQ
jgi:hypothetical protein